jgi:hypothetical protein
MRVVDHDEIEHDVIVQTVSDRTTIEQNGL